VRCVARAAPYGSGQYAATLLADQVGANQLARDKGESASSICSERCCAPPDGPPISEIEGPSPHCSVGTQIWRHIVQGTGIMATVMPPKPLQALSELLIRALF
jgi:hypothetical protein